MATTTYKVQAQFPATTQVRAYASISNKAITANLATVTTAAAHGITQVGTLVNIQGVDITFDGWHVIQSIPTGTTFTFVSSVASMTSAAVSPVGVAAFVPVTSGFTISNEVCQNYVATITTGVAHGLSVGDYVAVGLESDSIYNTLQVQVIAVPSTTTFCYLSATQTGATTAVTQGAVAKTTWQGSYTVPAATQGVSSSLYVSNRSPRTEYFRLFVRAGGVTATNQHIAHDVSVSSGAYMVWTTGLSLNAGEILTLQASSNDVTITLDGSEAQ